MSNFTDSLQQGSFRGVPFGVLTSEGRFGRRTALHEYPFRDVPWVEDLGRGTRKIAFVAFLISDSLIYGGGDVIAQREALIAAVETAGSGTLVHPTLGELTVSCPEDGCVITERWDEQRYFEIGFTFIEAGLRQFPSADVTGTGAVGAATTSGLTSISSDYVANAQAPLVLGSAVVNLATRVAGAFARQISNLVEDATNLYSTIVDLPAPAGYSFGRYFAGATIGFAGQTNPLPPSTPTTVSGLVTAGSAARSAVAQANAAMVASVVSLDPSATPAAASSAVATFLAAMPDPGSAVRLLTTLSSFSPSFNTTESVIGEAMATMQSALGDLLRRTALTYLVNAAATYQPASQTDAAALRDSICALIDAELTIAGDEGDDATFAGLRAMRTAIVVNLNARGASLPPTVTFKFAQSLPAPYIAQLLYQDVTRTDELISEAQPRHPGFMPVIFQGLAY